jgi:glutathione synthase/RimK-type ligase-like ATP-grasp enzyme
MTSNGSKPYQAQLIDRYSGFRTPPTLVTNSRRAVDGFEAREGPLIYKSISSVRSIVQPLDAQARQRLGQLRLLPTQFQQHLRGTDVRVHVVGSDLHATEIVSEAVDYRYSSRDGASADLTPIEVPGEIAERCVRLSRALELPFCGIDLLRSGDGWYCFEVNPSPGYSFYEQATGQPISRSLVEWLAGTDRREAQADGAGDR